MESSFRIRDTSFSSAGLALDRPKSNCTARDLVMLVAKHDRDILRYIRSFLPRATDAEEVHQRTAVVLWEKLDEYDAERDFLPWALHKAYYEVLNFRKENARSRLVYSNEVLELLAETQDEQAGYLSDMKDALRTCLAGVRESDLELLKGRYADSISVQQMAHDAGKSPKSLYRRLDRVRSLIQQCVQRRLARSN